MAQKRILVLSAAVLLLLATLVLATHIALPSSFSVNQSISMNYNISINNTDALTAANITQVNISLPTNITFTSGTNGSDVAVHSFSNTSSILSWSGNGFVMNGSLKYIWFNATASYPGSYNITVTSTNTTGPSISSNLTITVNDTAAPSIVSFASTTEEASANLSRNYAFINVSATDAYSLANIIIKFYYSNGTLINTTIDASSPAEVNFTSLSDGSYYVNATANDSAGNTNTTGTGTRTITIDTTAPTLDFSCDDTDVKRDDTINCTCTASDDTSGVNGDEVFDVNPSTAQLGSATTTCSATDYAGNTVEEEIDYFVHSKYLGGSSTGSSSTKTNTSAGNSSATSSGSTSSTGSQQASAPTPTADLSDSGNKPVSGNWMNSIVSTTGGKIGIGVVIVIALAVVVYLIRRRK